MTAAQLFVMVEYPLAIRFPHYSGVDHCHRGRVNAEVPTGCQCCESRTVASMMARGGEEGGEVCRQPAAFGDDDLRAAPATGSPADNALT